MTSDEVKMLAMAFAKADQPDNSDHVEKYAALVVKYFEEQQPVFAPIVEPEPVIEPAPVDPAS